MNKYLLIALLLPLGVAAGFMANTTSAADLPALPLTEPCEPTDTVDSVTGALCGSTLLWCLSHTNGVCEAEVKRCIHDNIRGLVDFCPATIDSFSIEGQRRYIDGSGGPYIINYDGDPILPNCGPDTTPIYLILVLRDNNGNPIGAKTMRFECTNC